MVHLPVVQWFACKLFSPAVKGDMRLRGLPKFLARIIFWANLPTYANADIFDFRLTKEELATLATL